MRGQPFSRWDILSSEHKDDVGIRQSMKATRWMKIVQTIPILCIREYGNTLYVGTSQVKNGRLYLRYGSSSEKTTAKCDKTVPDKKPCLYYCKNVPGVQLPYTKAERNKLENLDFVMLISSSFFITHNSKP